MKTLKAIVVEDERLPRLSLLQKLEDFRQQVEVVDSCDNYDSALRSILRHQPDLLFLDIQLQGRDALQLLNEVKQSFQLPHVIFTTAYADRKYLLSAIKLAAVDYLLKPIDKNELALAIAKACQQPNGNPDGNGSSKRLSLRTAMGKIFIDSSDIAYVTADGNYSHLFTFSSREDILESLATMEQLLDAAGFMRVDRHTIINTQRVYKLNVKRQLCTLLSPDGMTLDVELSKSGVERLMKQL